MAGVAVLVASEMLWVSVVAFIQMLQGGWENAIGDLI